MVKTNDDRYWESQTENDNNPYLSLYLNYNISSFLSLVQRNLSICKNKFLVIYSYIPRLEARA